MIHTHQTAPTQFVEANGIRFAYRRFGKSGGVPLVFNQHFTGTMDHWDPAVTDGFAKDREVILFNNAGVSSSSGEVPTSIEDMAANAIAFIGGARTFEGRRAGFLHRRLRRAGNRRPGARSRSQADPCRDRTTRRRGYGQSDARSAADFRRKPTKNPTTSGSPSISRRRKQARRRAASSSSGSDCARRTAIPRSTTRWRPPSSKPWANGAFGSEGSYDYLKSIRQPTLVVNGGNDVIIYSVNSFILQQHLPNAQLILYPDANHGSQYQYPELFVRHVSMFLSADERRGV